MCPSERFNAGAFLRAQMQLIVLIMTSGVTCTSGLTSRPMPAGSGKAHLYVPSRRVSHSDSPPKS